MAMLIYQALGRGTLWAPVAISLGIPYLAISVSLNILLTLMIVIRLILYSRNIRAATGFSGTGGLCRAIITILIESSALYAVSSLLVVGQSNYAMVDIFLPVLAENQVRTFLRLQCSDKLYKWIGQVIAPLLIINRVANRSALTSRTIVTGHASALGFRSRGESMSDGALPGVCPVSLVDPRGKNSGELEVGAEPITYFRRDDPEA